MKKLIISTLPLLLISSISAENYLLTLNDIHYKDSVVEKAVNNNSGTPNIEITTLAETDNGNVALVGYNGLTIDSYSHSSTHSGSSTHAVGAFDGHNDNGTNRGGLYNSYATSDNHNTSHGAIWMNSNQNEWIAVDFGLNINFSGFKMLAPTNTHPNIAGSQFKDAVIQTSLDGITYTDQHNFTTTANVDYAYNLATPVPARFVRLYGYNNHGRSDASLVIELEIYQSN